jgi:hypothetical protein
MAAVVRCVVGVAVIAALVGCGDDDDGSQGVPGPTANEDHWHAAFGVYVCDEFLPPRAESESPLGIHTHGDGVIHIHPFGAEAAGENATLRVFLDSVDIDVSGDGLTVDGETYTDGEDTCDGDEGRLEIVRWVDVAATDAEPEEVDADARFQEDGGGYVLAFVADGTDVPKPASADMLAELGAVDGSAEGTSTRNSTSSTSSTAAGGPPAVPDDRTLDDGFYPVDATEPAPCRSAGMRLDADSTNCYRLADEPAVGTEIVEDAEAVEDAINGGWRIELVVTEDGIALFNDVAAICSQRGEGCLVGQLALLVDGEVVMAPAISEPSFERDEIQVAGDFSRDEAEALIDALVG